MLRATEEWSYVEREVDIRVERERLDAGDRTLMLRRSAHDAVIRASTSLDEDASRCSRNFPEAIRGRPVTGQL